MNWQEKDDLIAFLLFKAKASDKLIDEASKVIGCGFDSLKMRISNFSHLDSGKGLDHSAAQSQKIFQRFKNL